MTSSKHSRRAEPISRSTYGFCHGEGGAVITSSIPSVLFVLVHLLPSLAYPDLSPQKLMPVADGFSKLLYFPSKPHKKKNPRSNPTEVLTQNHTRNERIINAIGGSGYLRVDSKL
jgi:hypothetical protein